jgi:hypothetical protein
MRHPSRMSETGEPGRGTITLGDVELFLDEVLFW